MCAAPVARIAGANRCATAAAVSAATFDPGVAVAYVATGESFPDALAGGAAAALDGAPLLLTTRSSLPSETFDELARLRPSRVFVLGGTAAVADPVLAQLQAATQIVPERLSGADRYATAAAISAARFPSSTTTAYVATGRAFPDALAAVPAAARRRAPVLLVAPDALPAAVATELARLTAGDILVLGGTAAIGRQTETDVAAYVTA